jgi:hypothetical protein
MNPESFRNSCDKGLYFEMLTIPINVHNSGFNDGVTNTTTVRFFY